MVRATLVYLRPGSSQFQRVEGNLQAIGFTVDADGMAVTSPESKQLFDKSRSDSGDLPSAYPVLRNGSEQIVDRANGVWVLPTSGMLRLDARGRLSDVLNNVSPRNSETYNLNPNDTAKLVDREGDIWFGEQKGVHRFFYSPLIKQELPKNEAAWFAVAADDQGEVWVWITEGAENAKLFRVANGRVESRNSPAGPVGVTYRSPDKTIWFGGTNGLWRLVDGGLVRVDLPKEMADQSPFLQTITQDHSGGMWVSFGRHGLYRLADGVWTSYGGREDLPKTGVVIEFTDSLGRVWFGYTKSQPAVLDGDHVQVFGAPTTASVWGTSPRFMDAGQKSGSAGSLGYSSSTTDASIPSERRITSCFVEFPELWKRPTGTFGSTAWVVSFTSAAPKSQRR